MRIVALIVAGGKGIRFVKEGNLAWSNRGTGIVSLAGL